MKTFFLALILMFYSSSLFAQQAFVDIKLKPAGSFTGKSTEVKGFATRKGDLIEASNIVVGLTKLETGIKLRDDHTRKHLTVEKFPEAILVSAKGQSGKGEGIIRIRGIEKPISGTYKVEGEKLNAEFPIKLSEFDIKGIRYMGVGVDDSARVRVIVPIKK
jgi:polyisoprenoid-binding protein YceI